MQIEGIIQFIENCSKEDLYTIRRVSQYRINGLNESREKPLSIAPTWAIQIAEDLVRSCQNNFKFVKTPDVNEWAKDIQRLNTVDKQSVEEIQRVAGWSQKDEFWKRQVRSGSALRRHFEKLLIASTAPAKDLGGFYCPKHPDNFVTKGKTCGYC